MEPSPFPEDRQSIPEYWIVLGLLIVLHAGLGAWLLGNPYFTQNPFGKSLTASAMTGYVMIGFPLSQPLLLAFWAAFAPQRFYQRFLWSLLLCIIVSFVEEIVRLREGMGQGMLLSLLLFIVATMLLLLFRHLSRWRIDQPLTKEFPSSYQAHQFGIKHIIVVTTIAALACGLFRTLFLMNPSMKWFPSVAEFFGSLRMTLAALFPVLVIPWYTLSCRNKMVALVLFTIVFGGLWELAAYFIAIATIPPPVTNQFHQIIKPIILLQLGAALSVLLTTLVMRFCGFRMIRMRKAVKP